jgi:hypothetical protein
LVIAAIIKEDGRNGASISMKGLIKIRKLRFGQEFGQNRQKARQKR